MLQRTLDTVAQDQSELIDSLFSLYVLFSHCSQYDVTLENCLFQILSVSLAYKHHSTRWKNKTYKLKPSHDWLRNQREGSYKCIKRFYSRGQRLCKFIGSKESVWIRKYFNFHRIGLHGTPTWPLFHGFGIAIWLP